MFAAPAGDHRESQLKRLDQINILISSARLSTCYYQYIGSDSLAVTGSDTFASSNNFMPEETEKNVIVAPIKSQRASA